MRKKIIVSLLLVAMLCTSLTMLFAGCKKIPGPPVDISNIQVFMNGEYYIGNQSYKAGTLQTENTLDLSKHFAKDTTFDPSGNKVSISGTNMTVKDNSGDFKMDIKYTKDGAVVEEELKVFIIDGINVYTFEEFYYAASQGKNIIVQNDMILGRADQINNALVDNSNLTIMLKANLYGNGHLLDATPIAEPTNVSDKDSWGGVVLEAGGSDILIQDVKIIGKNMTDIDLSTFDLSQLERYGILISYDGDGTNNIGGKIKNCVIENGHKVVFFNATNVTMEGTIIRNAADSLISIQTNNEGGSNVVLKNNVLVNSVVAGIVMWGLSPVKDENTGYVNLTIEGFLDIYNWKESSTAKLMPGTEGVLANTVNNAISDEFNKKDYAPYIYNADGKKFIHSGIIILATNYIGVSSLKDNKAKINGQVVSNVDKDTDKLSIPNSNFVNRGFPLPFYAGAVVNTCRIVGLGNNSEVKESDIKPGDTLDMNTNIYRELRDGRKAK